MPSLENQEWGLKYFCGANSHTHSLNISHQHCCEIFRVYRIYSTKFSRTGDNFRGLASSKIPQTPFSRIKDFVSIDTVDSKRMFTKSF